MKRDGTGALTAEVFRHRISRYCAVDGEPPEMAIDITWSHLSLKDLCLDAEYTDEATGGARK